MKKVTIRVIRACVFLLVIAATACVEAEAGIVMITTRKQVDTGYGVERTEMRGPGMTSPGDVAMGILLGNHGYASRLIIETLLASANPLNERDSLLQPVDPNFNIGLVIISGSSASADVPEPPVGIPVMMGEHVTLGNNAERPGSIYMYNGTGSSDPNQSQGATKFMKVVRPDHPIMEGIPLDEHGRVKIFRDQYPNEEQNVPAGGWPNYEYRWCTQNAADAAAGTTVLGVLDTDETRSCMAVVEAGGALANGSAASARLVHFFANENGPGSRRVFLALTDIAQTIFVRAARWAMGEILTPYKAVEITDIAAAGARNMDLKWEAAASHNYKIQASTDLFDWQTVIEDIAGIDGTLSRTLSLGPTTDDVFFRVAASP